MLVFPTMATKIQAFRFFTPKTIFCQTHQIMHPHSFLLAFLLVVLLTVCSQWLSHKLITHQHFRQFPWLLIRNVARQEF